jgi:hypothetical protein
MSLTNDKFLHTQCPFLSDKSNKKLVKIHLNIKGCMSDDCSTAWATPIFCNGVRNEAFFHYIMGFVVCTYLKILEFKIILAHWAVGNKSLLISYLSMTRPSKMWEAELVNIQWVDIFCFHYSDTYKSPLVI